MNSSYVENTEVAPSAEPSEETGHEPQSS